MLAPYEIEQALTGISKDDLYKATCKMLEDFNDNGHELLSSQDDIDKITDICNSISEQKSGVIGGQAYALKKFIAENLIAYGAINKEADVKKVFRTI